MSPPIIAVVNLTVKPKFSDSDLNVVESLLRKHGKITILTIDDDEMKFYIWADEKIDYSILDRLKEKLQEQKRRNFILSADEYALVGRKYYFE